MKIAATCIRAPVMRAHTEAINVTLREATAEAEVRAAVASMAGVTVVDDRSGNDFPTPRKASGKDDCLVGRIRGDESQPFVEQSGKRYWRGFDLLVSGDQLRKGAALNAVQIAELVIRGA
jgi:aspartate-semialdehyde dehydrogenase